MITDEDSNLMLVNEIQTKLMKHFMLKLVHNLEMKLLLQELHLLQYLRYIVFYLGIKHIYPCISFDIHVYLCIYM